MFERITLLFLLGILVAISYFSETLAYGNRIWFCIGGGLGVFFFYLFAVSAHYRKRQTPHAPGYRPFVSIVIPAKNEETVIRATVSEMMKIVYHSSEGEPNYELIVVDDGSTDRTLQVLQDIAKEYPNLVVYHRAPRPRSSKPAVLNEVDPICKGSIMAVFDADARVKPDFMERIIPFLADPRVGGVQAHKMISNRDVNWLSEAQYVELIMMGRFEEGRDLSNGACEMRGNGMIVKREAVADTGGWTEIALTEDLDMSTKMMLNGWEVRFCPDIPVYEEAVLNWGALYKQRRRWAEGSIRRYLQYMFRLLGPTVPLNKKADMLAFLCEFFIPIWMLVDLAFHVRRLVQGVPLEVSAFMYFATLMFSITAFNVAKGIHERVSRDWKEIIRLTIMNELFAVFWVPVILRTYLFMLVSSRPMAWIKTEHTGTHHDTEIAHS
ncbi:MAG: glycosyltransferase family 2 protein [Candidatus Sericytochromatia bacterium]|nr:glycosyltransferase family 2 protein [Candidatus Sericytochromatia bacterium]